MLETSPLSQRTALITGGSRKLGAAIALHLATLGAKVVVNYNQSHEQAAQVVETVKSQGGEAIAVQADISRPEDIAYLIKQANHEYGRLDILINNAGPYADDPLSELKPETWDWIINTNVRAAYLSSQHAFPAMRKNKWGRIINIAAGSAFVRNHSIYGLAKNSLITLTETLALEFAPTITVNAVAPGLIDDPEVSEPIQALFIQNTPLKRLVRYEEVASMVGLLCSSPFDLVTGQVITMDGGQTIPHGLTIEG